MNKIKEECDIFGIYSKKSKDKLVYNTAICLSTLQHRGEESCGIAVNKDGIIEYHKDIGLVSEVFTQKELESMPDGKMAIGHVRYSTTGLSKKENAHEDRIYTLSKIGNGLIISGSNDKFVKIW